MESRQLKLDSKVKLRLLQPKIKCSGRSDVGCTYRGRIRRIVDNLIEIEFKYKGEKILADYNLKEERFLSEELVDIKVLKFGS